MEPATQQQLNQSPATPKSSVNWRVFGASALFTLAVALWAIVSPTGASAALGRVVAAVTGSMGWFYVLTSGVVLVFMLWVAASSNGRRHLGPDDAKPQFGAYAWASMLFAAGIGVDLLFFSVAEPVAQYYNPPVGAGQSAQAARDAVVLTLFHYGITGWAIYALMGLAFGYFAYRFNLPLSIRSALYPLVGRRIHGTLGDGVEVAAVLGTIFGVATSLGIGVVQLNYGLHLLMGLPLSRGSQVALVSVAVVVATVSAVSGVDRGIKRLSELNVGLAIFLVLYVFATGRAGFLLNALVMNVGDYVASLPGLALNTYAFDSSSAWMDQWTLFFWAWWVAWAPFVGLFLARISKGRTLRQYVMGTLIIPFLFVLGWVSVFGNSALARVREGDAQFGKLALEFPERAFYDLLSAYPAPTFVAAVASLIGLLLYVTSADSSALVMANFTARIEDASVDGPAWSRVFWALATGLLTVAMLLVGGIPALQSATIVMGLPFALVLYLLMASLLRTFRSEPQHVATSEQLEAAMRQIAEGAPASQPADPLAELSLTWGQSLTRATSFPGPADCDRFVSRVARPALDQVATVVGRDMPASVEVGRVSGLAGGTASAMTAQLRVELGPRQVFTYTVVPTEVPVPSFALRSEPTRDLYVQPLAFTEVEGEQVGLTGADLPGGYDLTALTTEQVATDVSRRLEHVVAALGSEMGGQ